MFDAPDYQNNFIASRFIPMSISVMSLSYFVKNRYCVNYDKKKWYIYITRKGIEK